MNLQPVRSLVLLLCLCSYGQSGEDDVGPRPPSQPRAENDAPPPKEADQPPEPPKEQPQLVALRVQFQTDRGLAFDAAKRLEIEVRSGVQLFGAARIEDRATWNEACDSGITLALEPGVPESAASELAVYVRGDNAPKRLRAVATASDQVQAEVVPCQVASGQSEQGAFIWPLSGLGPTLGGERTIELLQLSLQMPTARDARRIEIRQGPRILATYELRKRWQWGFAAGPSPKEAGAGLTLATRRAIFQESANALSLRIYPAAPSQATDGWNVRLRLVGRAADSGQPARILIDGILGSSAEEYGRKLRTNAEAALTHGTNEVAALFAELQDGTLTPLRKAELAAQLAAAKQRLTELTAARDAAVAEQQRLEKECESLAPGVLMWACQRAAN